MEAILRKLAAYLSLVFALSGCANNSTKGEEKFQANDACSAQEVANEYIVEWKNGLITKVKHKSREALMEETILPNLEKIEKVNPNLRLFSEVNKPVPVNDGEREVIPGRPDSGKWPDDSTYPSYKNWGQDYSDALYAWDSGYRGQGISVAVIDSGVSIFHPMLQGRIKYNEGEVGVDSNGEDKRFNGVDDDNNGYVDDFAGYNFANNTPFNDATHDSSHGTHVSGIVSTDHNGDGIAPGIPQGVAPEANIVPIDFIDSHLGGTMEAAIASIDYVIQMKDKLNIKIINASWGGAGCSTILESKVAEVGLNGILFVAAAGNSGNNLDVARYKEFPAAFTQANQITVGSITPSGEMAAHSNYGRFSVDIFAPGHGIYSTVYDSSYTKMTGTSMAAPFVAGAAAVLWSAQPNATYVDIKRALLEGSVYNKNFLSVSGGSLNFKKAIEHLTGE